MMTKLVCYSLGNANSTAKRNFHREMHGYKDISCNGKYVYQRKGILHTIPHKKILDTIILTSDEKPLIKILKKYGAKIYIFSISSKKSL